MFRGSNKPLDKDFDDLYIIASKMVWMEVAMEILIVYLIGFLVWLGLLWFDSLWQLPFAALVAVGVIYAVCFAVRKFRPGRKRGERIVALLMLLVAALSVAVLFAPLTDWRVRAEYHLLYRDRMRFIGDLRRDPRSGSGEVRLPGVRFFGDAEAYVFDPVPDRLKVGFWVRRGFLSPGWIVLYTAVDAEPEPRELQCGEILSAEKFGPHWYYVNCN